VREQCAVRSNASKMPTSTAIVVPFKLRVVVLAHACTTALRGPATRAHMMFPSYAFTGCRPDGRRDDPLRVRPKSGPLGVLPTYSGLALYDLVTAVDWDSAQCDKNSCAS
jgi:hypothetical protein